MTEETKKEKSPEKEPGTLQAGAYEAEDILAGAEPWVPTETKLVAWSFIAALIALAVFGTLINILIL
ncbi:MAG: hypothetical protein ABII00_18430 [Elusimicrobiota bacterium]